ncbi:hypothetical protein IIA15_11700 [candidate division TA06 bacterium]|nr:hypothetical protein [candidate division TA06 bacterium]
MPKSTPQGRWDADIRERYQAFAHSPELRRLKKQGLAIFGRRRMFTSEEWWEESRGPTWTTKEFQDFDRECQRVGDRFGLNRTAITMSCLIKGYDHQRSPYPLAIGAKIRVVTESNDGEFIHWLVCLAKFVYLSVQWSTSKLNFPQPQVVQKNGSQTTPVLFIPFVTRPDKDLFPDRLPPRASAFLMQAEFPPNYPPDAAAELGRRAMRFERELARRLGYQVPKRMRTSPLAAKASSLGLKQQRLPRRGIYDLMDKTYGELETSQEKTARNRIKSQRNRVRRRFQGRGSQT